MRRLSLVIAPSLLAAGLLLPAPSGAARRAPCRMVACAARIVVGPEVRAFSSPQRFRPDREAISVRLVSNGARLSVVGRDGRDGCRRRLAGPGIRATVAVCGTISPVVVRARHTWGGTVKVDVYYRARVSQGVDGISAGSGSSGGVSPGSTGPGGISPRRAPRPGPRTSASQRPA